MRNRDDLNTRYIAALLHIANDGSLCDGTMVIITELILHGKIPCKQHWISIIQSVKQQQHSVGNYDLVRLWSDLYNEARCVVMLDSDMDCALIQHHLDNYEQQR